MLLDVKWCHSDGVYLRMCDVWVRTFRVCGPRARLSIVLGGTVLASLFI